MSRFFLRLCFSFWKYPCFSIFFFRVIQSTVYTRNWKIWAKLPPLRFGKLCKCLRCMCKNGLNIMWPVLLVMSACITEQHISAIVLFFITKSVLPFSVSCVHNLNFLGYSTLIRKHHVVRVLFIENAWQQFLMTQWTIILWTSSFKGKITHTQFI